MSYGINILTLNGSFLHLDVFSELSQSGFITFRLFNIHEMHFCCIKKQNKKVPLGQRLEARWAKLTDPRITGTNFGQSPNSLVKLRQIILCHGEHSSSRKMGHEEKNRHLLSYVSNQDLRTHLG